MREFPITMDPRNASEPIRLLKNGQHSSFFGILSFLDNNRIILTSVIFENEPIRFTKTGSVAPFLEPLCSQQKLNNKSAQFRGEPMRFIKTGSVVLFWVSFDSRKLMNNNEGTWEILLVKRTFQRTIDKRIPSTRHDSYVICFSI